MLKKLSDTQNSLLNDLAYEDFPNEGTAGLSIYEALIQRGGKKIRS